MKKFTIALCGIFLALLLSSTHVIAEEVAAEELNDTKTEATQESAQESATMKSVSGILAKRRGDATAEKKSLSLLDDVETPERPPVASRMFQGLALCLGVFFIGSWVVKRYGPQAGTATNRRIRVVERTTLTPKTALCLIEVDGKQVLLATGSDLVQVLMKDGVVSEQGADQATKGFDESLEVLCAEELKLSA
jgi:flagellar biogenesis protein FliO